MTYEEAAILDLIETLMAATLEGDRETVLSLIDEDAIFFVAGQKPFGKKEFAERFDELHGAKVEGKSDPKEIRVGGDWAWARTHIEVRVTPSEGKPINRQGEALTVYRRLSNDRWVLYRDANLVS